MFSKKRVILTLMLILILPITLAQEWDYSKESNYQNEDFLRNSDPDKWDFFNIDWGKIDFQQDNIYNSQEFYNNLPNTLYPRLDFKKVNYDLIDHLKIAKHSPDKYVRDFGCTDCILDTRFYSKLLIFTKEGIIYFKDTDAFLDVDQYPPKTYFELSKDSFRVEFHPSALKDMSYENILDFISPYFEYHDDIALKTEHPISLEGNTLQGVQLYYKKGEISHLFIPEKSKATINNVEIKKSSFYTRVYLDGEEHEYALSINKNNIILDNNFRDITYNLVFKEGNPYFDVKPGNEVSLEQGEATKLVIKKDPSGKEYTSLAIKGQEGYTKWAKILNGNMDILIGQNGISKLRIDAFLKEEKETSPMDILVFDEEENPLIKTATGEEGKLTILEDNNLIFTGTNLNLKGLPPTDLPSGAFQRYLTRFQGAIGDYELYASKTPPLENYLIENYGPDTYWDIDFSDAATWSHSELDFIVGSLDKLKSISPEMIKNLPKIEFKSIEEFQESGFFRGFLGGYHDGKSIALNRNIMFPYSSYYLFVHETAHSHHHNLGSEEKEFKEEWLKAVGDGDAERGSARYKEPKLLSIEEKGGWVTLYGSSDFNEDVAEFVSVAVTGAFKEAHWENPKLKRKMQLICEYGFIRSDHIYCQQVKE